MIPVRMREIFGQEYLHMLRRPIFWLQLAILLFMAWGLSTGNVSIQSGDARVGGQKAWLTSEFAVTQVLIFLVCLIYVFFNSVTSGMSLIRDGEHKVSELLHSTPLTPGEYVWGKFWGQLLATFTVLALHVGAMMAFAHLVPHGENSDFIGPFVLANYLRPALVFAAPTLVLFTGLAMAIGGLSRKPVLVFTAPVVVLLVGAFFLWEWSPVWLPEWVNRVLQAVDLTGLRWLKETWLDVDRGAGFYNTNPVGLDLLITVQRVACAGLGLAAVAWLERGFAAQVRGHSRARAAVRVSASAPVAPTPADLAPGLRTLAMRSGRPRFMASALEVARTELHELVRHPGLYLFVPLILIQVLAGNFNVGAFDTPLLSTSGTLAQSMMNTLTLLISFVILFYTVESLQREKSTGIGAIYYSTPLKTGAMLAGKAVANTVLGLAIVGAAFLGCAILLAVQGKVGLDLRPFLVVWGLLLIPTFLLWSAFVSATFALTANRYGAYAISLGALSLTGWLQIRQKLNWVWNWDLWSSTRWSDIATFEYDRVPLLLNRTLWLSVAVALTVFTVRLFERRERDATRTVLRLRPGALVGATLRATPYWGVPVILAVMLAFQVSGGYESKAAKKAAKDYWKKNVNAWLPEHSPMPTIARVDVATDVFPDRHEIKVRGEYALTNHTPGPIAHVLLTRGRWTDAKWTVDGDSAKVEDRAGLVVVTLDPALEPGGLRHVGFSYASRAPYGISRNGGYEMEFALPSSVVLTSLTPGTWVPQLGYVRGIGIEQDKNASDPREWPEKWYEGANPAGIAMADSAFECHLEVTVPADLQVNATGECVRDEVQDGRRVTEWQTDAPVRIFNLVAGKWAVKRREGVAVYYDPDHAWNIEEMLDALSAARKYYGEWFAPLPWKTLRLSEFAGLPTYAQAPPGNISFSEGIGFLTRSKPEANAAFWVTAHESAHQWWPNLAMIADGPGSDVMSEGMAHFSTILLTGAARGEQQRMAWCRQIEDGYANQRRPDGERPLVKLDGSLPAEGRIQYDKGGWAFWMLHRFQGEERSFAAIREYLETFRHGPDHAAIEDYLAIQRKHAEDPEAFDRFVDQWFFKVVVPQYRIDDARLVKQGDHWVTTATIVNSGTGLMPIEIGAVSGERFPAKDAKSPRAWQRAGAWVTLDKGQKQAITIESAFEPEKLVVDPDVTVLMLNRSKAEVRLKAESGVVAMR